MLAQAQSSTATVSATSLQPGIVTNLCDEAAASVSASSIPATATMNAILLSPIKTMASAAPATTLDTTPSVLTAFPLISNGNLKYICEICGILTPNLDSLKLHLNIHNEAKIINSDSNLMKIIKLEEPHALLTASATCKAISPAVGGDSFLNSVANSGNSKISTIIAAAKSSSLIASSNKKCSAIINIPQSMTVFNLKDISTKLSTFKQPTVSGSNGQHSIQTNGGGGQQLSLASSSEEEMTIGHHLSQDIKVTGVSISNLPMSERKDKLNSIENFSNTTTFNPFLNKMNKINEKKLMIDESIDEGKNKEDINNNNFQDPRLQNGISLLCYYY